MSSRICLLSHRMLMTQKLDIKLTRLIKLGKRHVFLRTWHILMSSMVFPKKLREAKPDKQGLSRRAVAQSSCVRDCTNFVLLVSPRFHTTHPAHRIFIHLYSSLFIFFISFAFILVAASHLLWCKIYGPEQGPTCAPSGPTKGQHEQVSLRRMTKTSEKKQTYHDNNGEHPWEKNISQRE